MTTLDIDKHDFIVNNGDVVYLYIQSELLKYNIDFRPMSETGQPFPDRILYWTSFPVTIIAGFATCKKQDIDAVVETIYGIFTEDSGRFRAKVHGCIDISLEGKRGVVQFFRLKTA